MDNVYRFLENAHIRCSWLTVNDQDVYLRKSFRAHPEYRHFLRTVDLANWIVRNGDNLKEADVQRKAVYCRQFLRFMGKLEEVASARHFGMVFVENLLNGQHLPFLTRCGYKIYPRDDELPCVYKLLNQIRGSWGE